MAEIDRPGDLIKMLRICARVWCVIICRNFTESGG